jgi:hypothetical protein
MYGIFLYRDQDNAVLYRNSFYCPALPYSAFVIDLEAPLRIVHPIIYLLINHISCY